MLVQEDELYYPYPVKHKVQAVQTPRSMALQHKRTRFILVLESKKSFSNETKTAADMVYHVS